ncbi:hypothetical protein RDV89_00310 [Nocardioides zeae]|uniref:Uncharacterized protein n=1 Tax=Nocardioides imazamoxiresistens TaxID=3231893 RepID=A0ABU3PQJ4_9ACTN|nr:hypothetical protein [Nocardioides zeae]MDT9591487.1 hypothetical protein [Nocardioides zeae]
MRRLSNDPDHWADPRTHGRMQAFRYGGLAVVTVHAIAFSLGFRWPGPQWSLFLALVVALLAIVLIPRAIIGRDPAFRSPGR